MAEEEKQLPISKSLKRKGEHYDEQVQPQNVTKLTDSEHNMA